MNTSQKLVLGAFEALQKVSAKRKLDMSGTLKQMQSALLYQDHKYGM